MRGQKNKPSQGRAETISDLTQIEIKILQAIKSHENGAFRNQLSEKFTDEALVCLQRLVKEKWLDTVLTCDPESSSAFDLIHDPATPYTLTDKAKFWLINNKITEFVTKKQIIKERWITVLFSIVATILTTLVSRWLGLG